MEKSTIYDDVLAALGESSSSLCERRGDDIPQICGKKWGEGGGALNGVPLGNGKIRPKNDADTMKETRCVTAIMRGTSRSAEGGETAAERADLSAQHKNAFFPPEKKGIAVTMECK